MKEVKIAIVTGEASNLCNAMAGQLVSNSIRTITGHIKHKK